jgi:hypothetical protein
VAVTVVSLAALTGGIIWFARLAPLAPGSTWAWPTSSTDAWRLDHALLATDHAVIVRNDHLAHLDFKLSIRNEGGVPIRILDQESAFRQWEGPGCLWHPIGAEFATPSWEDEPDAPLDPPFTLNPGAEASIQISGQLGDESQDPCSQVGLSWLEVEVPMRYSILDIHRTQHVPLDLVIGVTDDPDEWLDIDAEKLASRFAD